MTFKATLSGLAILIAGPAMAQNLDIVKPPIIDLEYGVMCDVRPSDSVPAPGTVSGVLNLVDETRSIDVVTQAVPADLGLSFGVKARIDPDSTAQMLDVVVTHPPMGDEGQGIEVWSDSIAPGDVTMNLFTFEQPFELIEGPWRFQLISEGEVILDKSFLVTPAGTVPAVQKTCFGAMIMS